MTRILGFHGTVNMYQYVVSSTLYHAIGLLRPQLINIYWYHFTVFDVHKRSRTLREMVTMSGYDPRAVFELLLNTAQFELKLKEVCYFLWAKWIVQLCLSSAKVQYVHLSWMWVFMQEVSFPQSLSGFQITYQSWKMCMSITMTFFTTSAQSKIFGDNVKGLLLLARKWFWYFTSYLWCKLLLNGCLLLLSWSQINF